MYLIRGLQLIFQPGLRRFVIIPFAINLSLFSVGIYLLINQFQGWLNYLMPDFPSWLSWLESLITWILWPAFVVLIFFVVFYSFSFVANLVASPFNGLLSEKTEKCLRGESIQDDALLPTWQIIKQSFHGEFHKMLHFLKWAALILIISVIPVINVVAPFLWFVFGAWMLALEYLDYPMSNHHRFFKDIKATARQNQFLTLGFGTALFGITSIPVLNFFAMPAGVAGATALWLEKVDQHEK